MKADLASVVELAVEYSGFDAAWWTKTIEDAQGMPNLDLDDPAWLPAQVSGLVANMMLAKLGETPHLALVSELERRITTIRTVRCEADAKWLDTDEKIERCWQTLRTVQQLAAAFEPPRN